MEQNEQGFLTGGMSGAATGAATGYYVGGPKGAIIGAGVGFIAGGLLGNAQSQSQREAQKQAEKEARAARRRAAAQEFNIKGQAENLAMAGLMRNPNAPTRSAGGGLAQSPALPQGYIGQNMPTTSGTF